MVAAKATGKAREFRRKVETMAVCREAAQVRLLEPFQPKPGFQPMPRKMHLERLAKHWKRMPRLGRLGVKVETRQRRTGNPRDGVLGDAGLGVRELLF